VKHTTREWRIDNRTFDEGARGTVIAEVLTTFGGITIRAEPTDDKLPSCEDTFYDMDEMNAESKSLYDDAKAAIKKARGL
jgi:hypothetical protein